MKTYTRRDFLKRTAGATALGMAAPELLGAEGSAEALQMAVARWKGAKPEDEPKVEEIAEKLTRNALTALGGMKRFVSRGDVVWIKPNMSWDRKPELAANCNPAVIAALVRLCLEAGAKKVKVGDNTVNPARYAYANSGIAKAAKEAGAEVVYLDNSRFREMNLKGERVKTLPVYPEIVESDLVINVAVPKHHGLSKATLCMKNYMGVVRSPHRRSFHQDIPTCLADLTRFMKPRLSVIDGIRTLIAHGPSGGNPKDVRMKLTVAAGVDIVALDAFGAELLGVKPSEIRTIVKGEEAGLGKMDYRSLRLKELALS